MQTLETTRTILRNLNVNDAQSFYDLNENPEVLKYTGDKAFPSVESAKIFLENYDQFEKYGVGRMAVILKETNQFIGWCGLKYSKEKDEFDIGFRFFEEFWNQGFATETASKIIDHAINQLNIQRIIGRAMKSNSASIAVLEKLGLNYKESFDFDGREGLIYEL